MVTMQRSSPLSIDTERLPTYVFIHHTTRHQNLENVDTSTAVCIHFTTLHYYSLPFTVTFTATATATTNTHPRLQPPAIAIVHVDVPQAS